MANSPASTVSSPRVAPQTEWDQKRHSFVAWIRAEFTKLAPMPTSLPLHEVFYGPAIRPQTRPQGVSSLRRRLNPPVHRVLHQTLIDPGEILQVCWSIKHCKIVRMSSRFFNTKFYRTVPSAFIYTIDYDSLFRKVLVPFTIKIHTVG